MHHVTCSGRECEAGCDFYGRPTDALWFNIPRKTRLYIAILLNVREAASRALFVLLVIRFCRPCCASQAMGCGAQAKAFGRLAGAAHPTDTDGIHSLVCASHHDAPAWWQLAWIFHFWSLAMHIVWYTYVQGQTWPGAFWQNLPFVSSIIFAICGGVMQGKAQDVVQKARPDLYPPKMETHIKIAVQKWLEQKKLDSCQSYLCCLCKKVPGEARLIDILRTEVRAVCGACTILPPTHAHSGHLRHDQRKRHLLR